MSRVRCCCTVMATLHPHGASHLQSDYKICVTLEARSTQCGGCARTRVKVDDKKTGDRAGGGRAENAFVGNEADFRSD